MNTARPLIFAFTIVILISTSFALTAKAEGSDTSEAQTSEWQAAMDAGESAYKHYNYDKAETAFEKAVKLAESKNSPNPQLVKSKDWLANVYSQQRKSIQCRKTKEEALSIAEEVYGKEDPAILESLHTLAQTLASQKDFDQAGIVVARAKEIDKKLILSIEPDDKKRWPLARTVSNLGVIYQVSGHNIEAEDVYSEAIKIAPKYPIAWANRGGLRHNMHNEAASLEDLHEAQRLGYDTRQPPFPKQSCGTKTN